LLGFVPYCAVPRQTQRSFKEDSWHSGALNYPSVPFCLKFSNVISGIEEGISPRQQVYFAIASLATEYLQSGQYHVYTGVLGGLGEDLLMLFDKCLDEIVDCGAIDDIEAKVRKAEIREGIEIVG